MSFIVQDRFLFLSMGKNDRESWVVKIDVAGLIDSLVEVRTEVWGESQVEMTKCAHSRDSGNPKVRAESFVSKRSGLGA